MANLPGTRSTDRAPMIAAIGDQARNERRLIVLLYLGTMTLMLLLTWITYVNMDRYIRTTREVRQHNFLLLDLENVMQALLDQESGARGFLLTYDSAYLEPYRIALENRVRAEEKVRALVAGTPFEADADTLFRQTARATDMHRIMVINAGRDAQRLSGEGDRLKLGKGAMDNARLLYRRMVDHVRDERRQLMDVITDKGIGSPLLIGGYSVLAITAMSLLFWRLIHALRRTQRVKTDLRDKVRALDEEVRQRRAVQDMLQQVLDTSPAGIMSFRAIRGASGRITDFEWLSSNLAANAMVGRSDLVGRRLLAEMPGNSESGLFDDYVGVVESGVEARREFHYRADGLDQWFTNHAVKLGDGFLVVFADISEQRRLQQLAFESERFELIGQITRTVAHEVRNPLTNIHLALEQLEEDLVGTGEDARALVAIVQRNLKRIGDLVKDMLESTRKREVHMTRCRLPDLVQAALETVADRFALRDMRATVELGEGDHTVQADGDLIVLATTNILVNAVEAMEPGSGELRMRVTTEIGRPTLTISDNGKGMSEEVLKRLFVPFYSGRPGGLGLGLTTTKSILNAHEVVLDVVSEPGKGSTFILRFPPVTG